jgi:hypothetical protein
VNEQGQVIAGTEAGEPQARMPALVSAQLSLEIAGRICRPLIRQSRLRWQAMVDCVRFARMMQINSIYISRVASRF